MHVSRAAVRRVLAQQLASAYNRRRQIGPGSVELSRGDALDGSIAVPWVYAQTVTTTISGSFSAAPGGTPAPVQGAGSLPILALRRWFASLTLSPPSITLGGIPDGLWAVLASLGALLLLALVVQGPRRAIGQLLDLRGHYELWEAAIGRVQRSVRLLIVLVGVSVITWTTAQGLRYADLAARDDLVLLLKDRRVSDVAWAQGTLAALTPLRDVVGLGLMYPMLLGATFVLFQYSTFRWSAVRPAPEIRSRVTFWATIGWGSTAFYAIDRFVGLIATGFSDRPFGGCLGLGALGIPALMALADGVLMAWVLVELRHGGVRNETGGTDDERLDVTGIVLAIPAAVVGCLLTFPARYIAAGVTLGIEYLPNDAAVKTPNLVGWLRWEVSWGLVVWQAVGLMFVGWLGAAAWSRGRSWGTVRGFGRLLRQDGARLVVVLGLGAVVAGGLATIAYALILSLPGASWVLSAADSYAHYATLPIGLITLAALVELGGRSAVPIADPVKSVSRDWAEIAG